MTAVALSAPDTVEQSLCREICQIYLSLAELPGLEPGPGVNALFERLVGLCEYRDDLNGARVLADPTYARSRLGLGSCAPTGSTAWSGGGPGRRGRRRPRGAADRVPLLGSNYAELMALEVRRPGRGRP